MRLVEEVVDDEKSSWKADSGTRWVSCFPEPAVRMISAEVSVRIGFWLKRGEYFLFVVGQKTMEKMLGTYDIR